MTVQPELALEAVKAAFAAAFPKLDRVAFGVSLGTAASLLLFLATLVLVLKGGDVVGPNLQLLGQYFPGYRVSMSGSLLGLAYGFVTGFAGGWAFAFLRNSVVFLYVALVQRRGERLLLRNLLEFV